LAKHNGPVLPCPPGETPPPTLSALLAKLDLMPELQAGPEAQIAAIADGIAYNNHDIDDGVRAGLFGIDDLRPLPVIGEIVSSLEDRYPGLERRRLIHESIRRLIDTMVSDLLAESHARLQALAPASADDIRAARDPVIAFGESMDRHDRALRAFLFARMYRHDEVNRETAKARAIVAELFESFMERPDRLPEEWRKAAEASESAAFARLVADYIAGMTDRYAQVEYQRLFDGQVKIC